MTYVPVHGPDCQGDTVVRYGTRPCDWLIHQSLCIWESCLNHKSTHLKHHHVVKSSHAAQLHTEKVQKEACYGEHSL